MWNTRVEGPPPQQGLVVTTTLSQRVRENLKEGIVLPIFHAVVRGGKPLFPADTHPLSSQAVEAGTAVVAVSADDIPKISNPANVTLDVLFTTAGEVIQGRSIFKDKTFPENEWEYNHEASTDAAKLVNTPAIMMGEDIEVTQGISDFFLTKAEAPFNLITRSLSRGVVASCFDASKSRSMLAITGSPGIGKSVALLYALQQALLYENACVMLVLQKRSMAFLFIRRDSRIFAWNAKVSYPVDSRLFERNDILVLLDPKESKDGGASYLEGEYMLIFAASNNEKHFTNDIFKARPYPERFLSPWAQDELKVALPVMDSRLRLDTALRRANDVGMLPRYILDKGKFVARQGQRRAVLEELEEAPGALKRILSWVGIDPPPDTHRTVPGTMFAVHAAFGDDDDGDDDDNNDNTEDDMNDNMEVDMNDDMNDDDDNATNADSTVGYDGSGISYKTRRVEIINDVVMEAVLKVNRKIVLSYWGRTFAEEFAVMGVGVEQLFWGDDLDRFTVQKNFVMARWQQTLGSGNPAVQVNLSNEDIVTKVPERLDIESLRDIFDSNDKVCRMTAGTPAIDFAGPGRKVYRVTVAKKHSLNAEGMIAILVQAGYLNKGRRGGITLAPESMAPKERFEFMWVVPKEMENTWKDYVPKRVAKPEGRTKTLQACLDKYVDQYVLAMDPDLAHAVATS